MSNMLERPQAYIGVSGVISPEMQSQLETMANSVGLIDSGRLLALGVKATHKTQYLDVENKYGSEWYPVGRDSFTNAMRPVQQTTTIAVAQTYLDVAYVDDSS